MLFFYYLHALDHCNFFFFLSIMVSKIICTNILITSIISFVEKIKIWRLVFLNKKYGNHSCCKLAEYGRYFTIIPLIKFSLFHQQYQLYITPDSIKGHILYTPISINIASNNACVVSIKYIKMNRINNKMKQIGWSPH